MSDYIKAIGDIAEVFDGPHATPKKTLTGPYFLSISSLENGYLDLTKSAHLSEEDFKNWTKRVTPKKGDILFSYETRLGEVALMPDDIKACLGRRMGLLRPNSEVVLSEYLLYAYLSPSFQQVIKANTITGATVNRIALTELPNFEVRIPPMEEQRKVSELLSNLDKKMKLNNQVNSELEAMAKTLYDYWFVQFDFPDADGKPYKSSGGKMVYNEVLKREIPEGWKDSTIEGIESNIVTGKTPSKKKSEYFNGDVPFITIGDIRANTFIVQTEETLTSEGADTQKNKYLPEDTICVTCIASPGLVGFVTEKSQTNQQINSVVCSNRLNMYYLYFAIKAYFEGAKAKTGNTFANMNKGDFSSINMLYPNKKLLTKYYEVVDPLFRQIKVKTLENKELEKLRDWLLPMLMNGQVTVK